MIQLKTFAWVRERVGTGAQTCPLPKARAGQSQPSVADLLTALASESEAWCALLDKYGHKSNEQNNGENNAQGVRLCFAVNHVLCDVETKIADGDEVAIFPPVTGG